MCGTTTWQMQLLIGIANKNVFQYLAWPLLVHEDTVCPPPLSIYLPMYCLPTTYLPTYLSVHNICCVQKICYNLFWFSFEVGRKKLNDKDANEKQKLKSQYKREMKAAMREVRKDRAFIADQVIKERVKRYDSACVIWLYVTWHFSLQCMSIYCSDAERQKKTNKILADLQGQQHELNMFHKMNKKPRRK